MGAIREIEWEPCLLERHPCPELEQRFRRETGRPGTIMQYFESCPWLADALVRLSVQINTTVELEPDLVDQAGLVVSQDNSCRFCFGMQRAFLRVLGMSEARINRLEADQLTGDFTARELAALDFSRRLSRSRPLVHIDDCAQLKAQGFSHSEIRELACIVAVHLFFNRVSTLAALPPNSVERFPDKWWIRLARPLVAIMLRKIRFRGDLTRLQDSQKKGPCAPIVNALDGLPAAPELRVIADGMWRDAPFAKRTVSLMFAVVARALGSTACEQQAREMLAADFSDTQIDHILDHLSSEQLSAEEKVLLSFTRETVWYQPAQVQRRAAEVQHQIGKEAFLHALGVVSFVNSVCRIGFVTELEP